MGLLGEAERDALIEDLSVFTRSDARPFVSGWIVEPTAAFFPNDFEPSEAGLASLADRLLAYAGMQQYTADVALDEHALGSQRMLPETRTDLAGVEGHTVFFACTQLGRADDAAWSLAHEVARAALLVREANEGQQGPYREARTTEMLEPDESDRGHYAASLFAAYLGLGVIATAGAHDYRQAGRIEGRTTVTEWQHVAYGGLAPEAASFLLAVQIKVRGCDDARITRLLAHLGVERQKEVRAYLGELDRDELVRALALPPIAEWAPAQEVPAPAPVRRAKKAKKQKPRVVFRLRHTSQNLGAFAGAMTGGIGVAVVHGFWFPRTDASLAIFACMALGGLIGWGVGLQRGSDRCAACGRALPASITQCPGCMGLVIGRIENGGDQIEAREKWERSQPAPEHDQADEP